MNINKNDIVSIRHCSGKRLFRCVIVDKNFDDLVLNFIDEIVMFECSEGDPVVLGFESENEIYIASCNIIKIDKVANNLSITIDSMEILRNKRLSERFPVSVYSNIKIGESQTKHIGLIKNISFTGILLYSKSEFPLYQKLKININVGVPLTIQAVVVRKSRELHNFEYGLKNSIYRCYYT